MKIMAFILMLVVSIPMAFAKDADIEFRLRSKLITKLFNQAMSNFTAEDGYIKESISSQTYTMNLKLSDYMDIEDPHYYGEKLLGLNLKGESKVNLLFKHPYVQAKVTMKDPKFTSKNKAAPRSTILLKCKSDSSAA